MSDSLCRAAHEKIAFGLGRLLSLPVAPVVLWDRGLEKSENRYLAISARLFDHAIHWTNSAVAALPVKEREKGIALFSAMHVFYTWIADRDRNESAALIDGNEAADGRLRVGFIDHDKSLSEHAVWPDNVTRYPRDADDRKAMSKLATEISVLKAEQIQTVVNLVPIPYLPVEKRLSIAKNLIDRKDRLHSLLGLVAF
jgi:hypothetical protein